LAQEFSPRILEEKDENLGGYPSEDETPTILLY